MLTIEKNGEKFNEETLLTSQKRLVDCIQKVAGELRPGMSEKETSEIMQRQLTQSGFEKNWHAHKIRFGPNTLKTFSDTSDASIVLQESDIFFFDLGPVINDHECDYGETFVIGNNPELIRLRDTAKILFHRVKEKWKTEKITGEALYQFAVDEAKKEGYTFVTRGAAGHRIGDFPHHVHYRGAMNKVKETLASHRWILEIQIHDEKIGRGAFFEDIL